MLGGGGGHRGICILYLKFMVSDRLKNHNYMFHYLQKFRVVRR